MSIIKELESDISKVYTELGYKVDKVTLNPSNRRDLGEYQLNDSMKLAKEYHKSPIEIAKEIVERLKEDKRFTNINIAGSGFINISLSDEVLIELLEKSNDDIMYNIDLLPKKRVIIDYGGANVAKALHVGHLRSPNIGEAIKRLARLLGYETISDVHLGDSGLQTGIIVLEIKERYPNLECFKENYDGKDFILPIETKDLSEIYPTGSKKSKEDENFLEEARDIALKIQQGHKGYMRLWEKVSELSIAEIKKTYERLNTTFDLWEGEIDSFKYMKEIIDIFESQGLIYTSDGARVMDVKEETDTLEIPPIIIEKTNGAYMYSSTDLATIYGRMKRFNPDEIWYFTDIRQSLHFEQVFRAARKSKIVNENTKLEFLGFGTMNGSDGKPFKTRNGGTMELDELINIVKEETLKRINKNIVSEEKVEETSEILAIGALKYADLIPFRGIDYIFDPSKFSDLEGKTAPYLMYSTLRMKSLLNKAKQESINYSKCGKILGTSDKEILLILLELPRILTSSLENKSLNEIADYIYKLTSSYNKFYSETRVLTEENEELKSSWLIMTEVVHKTNIMLLDIMGLKCPEKM